MSTLEETKPSGTTIRPSDVKFHRTAKRAKRPRPEPRRGDIWFVGDQDIDKLYPQHVSIGSESWSNRLAVVVSNDRLNMYSHFVDIVYLNTTTRRKPNRVHVEIETSINNQQDKDPELLRSIAFCEQVHTVDISRLYTLRGRVNPNNMREINDALGWTLGLNFQQDPRLGHPSMSPENLHRRNLD